ncbi:MAG TPA: hypothetical protein DD850_04215 [Erwinia persicina]|uniref:Uncharacterized protein n=1 Tax=Erwinia persicina TaxID=55211 RepID=A0A3S7S881_9GAMM|nr:hypothetical protein CI789_17960 [Erwinia persicina]TKJ87581.1 hypothetical protein EpCFBP13511_16360 [Erwinia persicina]HBH66612.1 hypothetical protein [Erwinia persicina]HBH67359.1 hypothetical protein [Erwinia persicina]HBI06679.1 hypothetical protein [Erwinia persicina]
MPEVRVHRTGMAQRSLGYIDIILTVIRALLNLYAKTFRCPDVLTSISTRFTLSVFTYTPAGTCAP